MPKIDEVEELANKRALEFIKCVQYLSVKEAIHGIYLQGCKDMAQTLIEKGYSEPQPKQSSICYTPIKNTCTFGTAARCYKHNPDIINQEPPQVVDQEFVDSLKVLNTKLDKYLECIDNSYPILIGSGQPPKCGHELLNEEKLWSLIVNYYPAFQGDIGKENKKSLLREIMKFSLLEKVSVEQIMDILNPYWRENVPYKSLDIIVKKDRNKAQLIHRLVYGETK